jgi:hypothetical protein
MDLAMVNEWLTAIAIICTLAMLAAWYKRTSDVATGFALLAVMVSLFGIVFGFIRNNYETGWAFGFALTLATIYLILDSLQLQTVDHTD